MEVAIHGARALELAFQIRGSDGVVQSNVLEFKLFARWPDKLGLAIEKKADQTRISFLDTSSCP